MDTEERIAALEEFKALLVLWKKSGDAKIRAQINRRQVAVRREVIEAKCFKTLTISPPPAVGGLIMRNIDPFNMMFDPPPYVDLIETIVDMIDQTIGVLTAAPAHKNQEEPEVRIELDVEKGYAFIAMPIDPADAQLPSLA